jgi:iron complex outermembrane receptor protein
LQGRPARVLGAAALSVGFCVSPRAAHAQAAAPAVAPPSSTPAAAAPPEPAAPAAAAPSAPEAPPAPEAAPAPGAAPEPVQAGVAAEAASESLDAPEIVVTIDRRRKDLQDYSGTASAFSASQLSSVGVHSVKDLAVMVPGLTIGTQESGTTIYVRGIGSDNNTELGDPAVALHVDGVYMPRPRGFGALFFDIERVEVNSGPQGTLRGRNAVGGTINVVTKQPNLTEFDAMAEATLGSYSLRAYQGMINLPIVSEQLGLRVAARSEVHDPHWQNAGPLYDLRAPQSQDDYALRVTAKYQPSAAFDLTLAYDLVHEGGTGTVGANFQPALTRRDENNNIIPFDPNDVDNPRRVYLRGFQPSLDMDHQGVRASANLDAGPVLFEALASYRNLDYKQYSGPTNTIAAVPGLDISSLNPDTFGPSNQWYVTSDSWIGELRAYAPDTDRLRWTAGAFYFYEDQGAFLGQNNDPVTGSAGGEFNMPHTIGWSLAGYADATFDVLEDFRVLGGLRVTHDHKDRKGGFWGQWTGLPAAAYPGLTPGTTGGRFGTEGFRYKGFDRPSYVRENDSVEARVNLFLDGIASFGARDELPIALCNDPPAAEAGQPPLPRVRLENGNFRCTAGVRSTLPEDANIFPWVPQDNEVNNNFVDWRAGVEYDLQKNNLLYVTFSTGRKAAGFNDTQAFADRPLYNSAYGPESVYSLELGSKNLFFERALRLNASAFYFAYQGMQFQTIVSIPDDDPNDNNIPPTSAVRQNADERTDVLGLDLDVSYRLPAGLQAELRALLMDARFSDGTVVNDSRLNFGAGNASVDLGGNWLPRASPYTLNYTLSQLLYSEVGAFDWVIQGQTRATQYMTVFNGDGTRLVRPAPGFDFENPNYAVAQETVRRFTDIVPTYTIFNVGAGWKHPDGRLSLSAFVNNVFDIAYATPIVSTGATNIRYFNAPRVAGVRARVDW